MMALGNDYALEAQFDLHRGNLAIRASIKVGAGEIVALLGPNGAGKTTLLECIAGGLAISNGYVSVGGSKVDDPGAGIWQPPEKRQIGMVFQDNLLFPHMNVIDNVAFSLRCSGHSKKSARRRASEVLLFLGIAELERKPIEELSGGQTKQVAIARSIIQEPSLLLLDEPLSGLDSIAGSKLKAFAVNNLKALQTGCLLVTHDSDFVVEIADRVYVLESGIVTEFGQPDELRAKPNTPYIANFAGTNSFIGVVRNGQLVINTAFQLQVADLSTSGPVNVSINPRSISLHRNMSHGSPRNNLPVVIDSVESLGDITRIVTAEPTPLVIDITTISANELNVRQGEHLWATIKATEINVEPLEL
jgi:molybdate transport system ATP-binding protein